MPQIDWSEEERGPKLKPGTYKARVARAEEGMTKGDPPKEKIDVVLEADDFKNAFLCYDTLVLTGKGRGLGQSKLKALGFKEDRSSVEAADLLGRRVYVKVHEEEWPANSGKKRLKVESLLYDDEFGAGYAPESLPPADVCTPGPADIPF